MRIVVADDETHVREGIVSVIREVAGDAQIIGHAATVEEVETQVRLYRPDLVLLDIRMPDINGDEVLRRIRAQTACNAGIPAVAVTANAMTHQIDDYLANGFAAHVSKPIRLADLTAAIRRAVPERVAAS